ncbi:MAG TPA: hypothetical protein VMD08_02520 [Candidatus Baltobacteraceae bacterium]|nr:hypothetical protein [Candidatus Baltobacteraceae bacterium]
MPTIVTYTDTAAPRNQFPRRIISPTHSGPCCFSSMQPVGEVCREERYEYAYRRCCTCGFTVRVIVRSLPDEARLADLRRLFARTIRGKFGFHA